MTMTNDNNHINDYEVTEWCEQGKELLLYVCSNCGKISNNVCQGCGCVDNWHLNVKCIPEKEVRE